MYVTYTKIKFLQEMVGVCGEMGKIDLSESYYLEDWWNGAGVAKHG